MFRTLVLAGAMLLAAAPISHAQERSFAGATAPPFGVARQTQTNQTGLSYDLQRDPRAFNDLADPRRPVETERR